jgi:maleate isomerase
VQERIVANYAAIGIDATLERHLGDPGNFSYALIPEATIRQAVAEVAAGRPDAIAIVCTNLRAAQLAADLERQHGMPVIDSLTTAVWASLELAGVDTARVADWGSVFGRF